MVVRGVQRRELAQVEEVARCEVGEGVEDRGARGVVAGGAEDLEDGRAEEGVEEGVGGDGGHFWGGLGGWRGVGRELKWFREVVE